MAIPSEWLGDYYVNGQVSCNSLTLPASSILRDAFSTTVNYRLTSSKFERQHMKSVSQANGSDVASATYQVHHCRGTTGEIVQFEVFPSTAPTGGDKQYTVDLQKKSIGGSFATVLSAVVTMSSADSDRTAETATISSAALVDGDELQIVVTASGSTGSQGQGFVATVTVRDDGE